MKHKGVTYHGYAVITTETEFLGFDARNIQDLKGEWLAKWKKTVERGARRETEEHRRAILNAKIERQVTEGDNWERTAEDVVKDVEHVDPLAPSSDEIFELSGLPTGIGSVAVLAEAIIGIQRVDDAIVRGRA